MFQNVSEFSKRALNWHMCSSGSSLLLVVIMACLTRTGPLPSHCPVFLFLSRSKTTRPQEWKDKSQYLVKIHPDQRREEETPSSRHHKWMDVRWKGKNSAETLIHSLAIDECRRSDPKEARKISDAKLEALSNSLRTRGFCRERKAYEPLENVEDEIRNALQTAVQSQQTSPGDSWLSFPLTDPKIKLKFLLLCASRLNHQVPNSDLYLMKTVHDVVKFYKEPVRGSMTFDHLIREQKRDELPPNLHLVPGMNSYDPNSEFMGGIDAFPGNPDGRFGIREKIKYPAMKQTIPWPDI